MNKPNVDKFLCEQINKNEYKVLKEFSLSKLNVRYKASLTEHVYDEETATFLSKAFLFSNSYKLLWKSMKDYNPNIEPLPRSKRKIWREQLKEERKHNK